jgi:uncharacterized protein YqgV (UPF0045/DUF77 family)
MMEISVELTLTPLQDDFEPAIKDFIKKLRASNFKVVENPLSTQVFGEYDAVMRMLTLEVKETFKLIDKGIIFMKIVKSNRQDYEPSF